MNALTRVALDWNDVRGVIVRQGSGNLDWSYIRRQLTPLCELKENPEIMERLEGLRVEIAASGR